MIFQNWLSRTFGTQSRVPRASRLYGPLKPARPRFAPKAEHLEDRAVPAILTVNSIADNTPIGDGLVTLREAISASINHTTTDLSQTGDGNDTIQFSSAIDGQTIKLTTFLNDLSPGSTMPGPSAFSIKGTNLTIDGETGLTKGIIIARDTTVAAFRLIFVGADADVTIKGLTLKGGLAQGGSALNGFGAGGGGAAGFGGAIFNDGRVTIQNSTLTGNKAQGGSGGPGEGKGQGNGGAGLGANGGASGIRLPENGGEGGGPNGGAGGSFGGQGGNGAYGGGGGGGQVVSELGITLSKGAGGNGGFGGGGGGGGGGNYGTGENGGNGGFGGGGGGTGGGSYFGTAGAGGFGGGPGVAGVGGGGAGMGGAIFNHSGNVSIFNSTVTGNTATGGVDGFRTTAGHGYGAGVFNYNGTVSVTYSTISANEGTSLGSGIFNLGNGVGNSAIARINNSIIGQSGSTDLTVYVINGGSADARGTNNVIPSTFIIGGGTNSLVNTVVGDPKLDSLKNNGGRTQTMGLLPGSPAIDQANGDLFRAFFDQRGFARNIAAPDIGAFEGLANSAPTGITLSAASIAENAGVNGVIGTLAGTDPDAGDTLTFSLPSGLGDNAAFNISGTTLRASASFDFEAKNSYSITLRATDVGRLTFDKVFTIAVTNINEMPTAIALSNAGIAENAVANSVIGMLTGTDPDAGDSLTFSLPGGLGYNDAFNISGTSLRANAGFDFETKSSYLILVRATDAGGLTFDQTFTISVTNVNEAPTLTRNLVAVTVNEGSTATNTGTFGDPEGKATVTLTASLGTVVKNDANGTWSWNYVPADNTPAPTAVTITAKDTGGLSSSTTFTLDVRNVAPAASVTGPKAGVRYLSRSFTLSASDPSSVDAAAGFTYSVNWGDGSPLETVASTAQNGAGVNVAHTYIANGTYTVSVTARDKDGTVSGTSTRTITITPAALLDDPLNPGKKALFVGGTSWADEIEVDAQCDDRYVVEINSWSGHYRKAFDGPISRVVVIAGAGDDKVEIDGGVRVPVWVYGGEGDDTIHGGKNAPNVLLGEGGIDRIWGGHLRDILIGGARGDVLMGSGGNDLLIGGSTAFDGNEFALRDIQSEWLSDRTYEQRVTNLRGTGTGARLNGDTFLKGPGPGATVFDDGSVDRLVGGKGRDWYIAIRSGGAIDKFNGLQGDEWVDNLG